MKTRQRIAKSILIAVAAGLLWAARSEAASKLLKVFILAGQSNMEGPARIDTFDYIGDDPATASPAGSMITASCWRSSSVMCVRTWTRRRCRSSLA